MTEPKKTAKRAPKPKDPPAPKPYTKREQGLAHAAFERVHALRMARGDFSYPWDDRQCKQSTRDDWCEMARVMVALIKAGAK